MKKVIIGIAVVILIAIIAIIFMITGKKEDKPNTQTGVKIETAQEMQNVMTSINTKLQDSLPGLEVREIDITDEFAFSSTTGLKSTNNVEAVIVSEPFINAQAYSAVMVKVSKDANIEEMKKEMLEGIDMRKWICVSAEKLRITNYEDVIFLVMSSEEWGKPVYDEFKNVVGGNIGKELEKTEEI
ncbi:MAG: hypothetical protein HFJ50_04880 [Clostridia bacterium]|jgi:acid phosphatase class B|nr:hypothetical protein [Clostridia bacterium]